MADPDLQTLQTRLIEAEAAYHKLLIGSGVQSINYEGRGAVTYTKADLPQLQVYIASLRSQIAQLQGCASAKQRPIVFGF